ncbi:MAG: rod shape-determining protein MreC [Patescibacteria group bacterium]|nr:rod shape-determining protein MreC [Patescibacteria group bacterium]
MKRKENFLLAFLVFALLSLLFLGLSKIGVLNPVSSVLQKITAPFQSATYNFFNSVTLFGESPKLKKLQAENLALTSMLSDQKKLKDDNAALSDQFKTVFPNSNALLPANIVGAPKFIPGISAPETFIINRGTSDGVTVGKTVVYKNNLIGKVTKASDFLSEITLITNSSSSFTARTSSTQALGVIKGQGEGQMILDNVLLSDSLKLSDLVLTNGDVSLNGSGYPPDLVVGKIVSVDKKASSLFQRAEVSSFIDFSKITTVFILVR